MGEYMRHIFIGGKLTIGYSGFWFFTGVSDSWNKVVGGKNLPSSSWMAASVGFTLRLILPLVLLFGTLRERVTVRAPLPPATVGRPTPSLY